MQSVLGYDSLKRLVWMWANFADFQYKAVMGIEGGFGEFVRGNRTLPAALGILLLMRILGSLNIGNLGEHFALY